MAPLPEANEAPAYGSSLGPQASRLHPPPPEANEAPAYRSCASRMSFLT